MDEGWERLRCDHEGFYADDYLVDWVKIMSLHCGFE